MVGLLALAHVRAFLWVIKMSETYVISNGSEFNLKLFLNGQPINFETVTRAVVEYDGSSYISDSNVDSSLITWNKGNGILTLSLGSEGFAGKRDIKIKVYDPLHTNGQYVFDSRLMSLALIFQ